MVELLQLLEAGLVFTAVTLAAVSAPVVIITGEQMPDMSPMLDKPIHSDTTTEEP